MSQSQPEQEQEPQPLSPDTNDSIQLINEQKEFSKQLTPYLAECLKTKDIDQNYHVISVFGSQSSGKSTLLNFLFNTHFDTMDANVKRQQTTKGIWLSHTTTVNTTKVDSLGVDTDIFVLDVEGSDGAERGEDQDFERKATLFAIAVSEVLIINLWEHQIGLYQGNNLGLLKTVFEVNLSLFGHGNSTSSSSSSSPPHRVLLLFVIRDHVGVTPMSSLSESLVTELEKIWDSLNKPEPLKGTTIYDFFDMEFVGLNHKILRADKFVEDVKSLGDRFALSDDKENYLFKPEYHHMLPLDAWSMYAENCWDQIENNKDLDLPTQQILVSRYKTDEIMKEVIARHLENFDTEVEPMLSLSSKDKGKLVEFLVSLKNECLEEYDNLASRYTKVVYLENRSVLITNINNRFLTGAIDPFLANFAKSLVGELSKLVEGKGKSESEIESESARSQSETFIHRLLSARQTITSDFDELLQEFMDKELLDNDNFETLKTMFAKLADDEVDKLRDQHIKSIISKFKKGITYDIRDDVVALLANPSKNLWDRVLSYFNERIGSYLGKYKVNTTDSSDLKGLPSYDFQVGLTDEQNTKIYKKLRYIAWSALNNTVHDYLKEDTVVNILRDRFENSFRFSSDDTPILWKNEHQIDEHFRVAKEHALEVLNVLCIAKTKENVEIVPDVDISEIEYEDDSGVYHMDRFAHILNELQKEKILRQFRRQINLSVVDAKRSIITTTTRVPIWMYFLLVVLGWNEFMLIIKNPLLVTLILISLVGIYFLHKFDMWAPVITVAKTAVGEVKSTVKSKLRDFVLDDNEIARSRMKAEEYEMQDLGTESGAEDDENDTAAPKEQ